MMGTDESVPAFAIAPPVEPMLAKLTAELPVSADLLDEPNGDGFRAIVIARLEVFEPSNSRDLRPLDR